MATVVQPVSVTYPVINGSLKVLFTWSLQPNKNYVLDVTANGTNYFPIEHFTGSPNTRTHSHTVDPVAGPYWPRLSEA